MAFQHIYFAQGTEYGFKLRSALSQLEDGVANLVRWRDVMTSMVDGDGSSATQFGEVTARFGFTDNASAKSALDEINSALSKVTTDDSVTSTKSALAQAFSKLR